MKVRKLDWRQDRDGNWNYVDNSDKFSNMETSFGYVYSSDDGWIMAGSLEVFTNVELAKQAAEELHESWVKNLIVNID